MFVRYEHHPYSRFRIKRLVPVEQNFVGREAIPRHPGLDKLAQRHCEFMARNRGKFTLDSANISHFGFEGRALVAQRRYKMAHCAENVAGGFIHGDIAAELTQAWLKSSKHAYNLKQVWHATGLGVFVTSDGFVYATQFFATKDQSKTASHGRLGDF